MKQALFDYMEWAESVDHGAWAMLASDHYGRMVEPNHLQRSLDILETMGILESFSGLEEDLKRQCAARDVARCPEETLRRVVRDGL